MESAAKVSTTEHRQNLLPWKRLIVIGASFGVAFALALSAIVAATLWYSSRPKPPKPWKSKAIIATFDYPGVEEDTNPKTIVLYYTLENTMEADYRMPKKDQLGIKGRLRWENSLSGGSLFPIDEDENFLPPEQRRRFALHLGYPMKAELVPEQTKGDQRRQWQVIANFMKKEMPNLNGFVTFDTVNRYQIELPNGWDNLDLK